MGGRDTCMVGRVQNPHSCTRGLETGGLCTAQASQQ